MRLTRRRGAPDFPTEREEKSVFGDRGILLPLLIGENVTGSCGGGAGACAGREVQRCGKIGGWLPL